MFEIVTNNFLGNGRVRYEDECGNKLIVSAEKTGKQFSIKLRPNNGIKMPLLKVDLPDGNVDIPYPSEALLLSDEEQEVFKALLNQMVEIMERWTVICSRILILTSSSWNLAVKVKATNDETTEEDAEQNLGWGLIEQLGQYEEATPYVQLYLANPKTLK